MAGKPALKYAVKYYVKRYYRPAAADSVTVEQLKKVTDYREPEKSDPSPMPRCTGEIGCKCVPCVAVAKHLHLNRTFCRCSYCTPKSEMLSDTTVVKAEARPKTDQE